MAVAEILSTLGARLICCHVGHRSSLSVVVKIYVDYTAADSTRPHPVVDFPALAARRNFVASAAVFFGNVHLTPRGLLSR